MASSMWRTRMGTKGGPGCGVGQPLLFRPRSLRSSATLQLLPSSSSCSAAHYSTGFNRRKREESKKRQEEEEERQRNQQQHQDGGGGGAKGNQDEWLRSDERTESLRASERHALRLGVPFAIALLFIAQGSRVLFGDEPSKDTIDHDEQLRLEGDDGRQGGDDLLLEEEGEKE